MRRAPIFMRLRILGGLAVAVCGACGTSSSPAPAPVDVAGSCRALASQCHPYGEEPGLGRECHDLGHAGDDAACAPRKAECLAACPKRDGGASHPDDAATSAPVDGASDATPAPVDVCPAYCECLDQTCSSVAGYPFADVAACLAACAQLSDDEESCLPKWCSKAKTSATNKVHLCEHAWGKLGLDECETL